MGQSCLMSEKETGKRRGRNRPLSEEEHKLWQFAMREASPLPRRSRQKATEKNADEKVSPPQPAQQKSRPAPLEAPSPPARRPPPNLPPPLTGIDRRTSQRLGRGQIEFDAKLDLHGHSREDAFMALRRFLTDARRSGLRCVLVVTGKGDSPFARHTLHSTRFYDTPERQGVLRSALPQWLEEPELRALVSGFQPAHPKHGGGGAFYVLLRRSR